MARSLRRRLWGRCLWLCLSAVAAAGVAAFLLSGASIWAALLVAAMLACLAVMLGGSLFGIRPLPVPLGPVPQTTGVTLGWLAPYYDGVCRLFGIGPSFRARTIAIARLQPGERVLDVGCGTGVLTRRAAEAVVPGGWACGIDPAPDMIGVAWEGAAIERSPARFLLAAIESIPLEPETVDVVLISFVLHCLPDEVKRAGLREVRRVMRPAGRILVVDLDRPGTTRAWLFARLLLRHRYMAAHLEGRTPDLLHKAGFERVARVESWRGLVGFWTAERPG